MTTTFLVGKNILNIKGLPEGSMVDGLSLSTLGIELSVSPFFIVLRIRHESY